MLARTVGLCAERSPRVILSAQQKECLGARGERRWGERCSLRLGRSQQRGGPVFPAKTGAGVPLPALLSPGTEEGASSPWFGWLQAVGKKFTEQGKGKIQSPCPYGPAPSAACPLLTCQGASRTHCCPQARHPSRRKTGSRHGSKPFYWRCLVAIIFNLEGGLSQPCKSQSLHLFLRCWLPFHQVFLLRALEESREESSRC